MVIDPISRGVFQHEIVGIAEEMSSALRQSAYSSIIWDMYDYACGLLMPSGEMIAQAQTIPAQLGIMSTAIIYVTKEIPLSTWQEGDVVICNDPYRGCTHTPDIVLFSPVFYEGRLVAVTSTIAHHIDMGGVVPGTEAANALEIFGEGLRIPALKLIKADEPNTTLWDIIATNVRNPESCHGDLRAQIAGCRTGEKRVQALVARYGVDGFKSHSEACLNYAETYMRNSLEEIGNGSASEKILIEDDVTSKEPIVLQCTVSVVDKEMRVDFTGTSVQRANGLNCPHASTISMVHYAVKAVLAPDLGQNEGCVRPIKISIPKGTILNPDEPGAVSVRHLTQQAVADVVLKTLAGITTDATAGCHISFPTFTAGGFDDRAQKKGAKAKAPYFVIADIIGGGMGGFPSGDGMDAIDTHGGNCALLSAEVMETMSPFRVLKSELIAGTGGKGKYRGGLSMRRDYEVLSSSLVLSGYLQQGNEDTQPWGINGGSAGAPSAAYLAPDSDQQKKLNSKFVGLELKQGEIIRLVSAGGGGWGNPKERSSRLIQRDQQESYV